MESFMIETLKIAFSWPSYAAEWVLPPLAYYLGNSIGVLFTSILSAVSLSLIGSPFLLMYLFIKHLKRARGYKKIEGTLQKTPPKEKRLPSLPPKICEETTLEIIKAQGGDNGMEARHIQQVYKKRGLDVKRRIISIHIAKLVNKAKVFQVNPAAQRYRRYKAIQSQIKEVPECT